MSPLPTTEAGAREYMHRFREQIAAQEREAAVAVAEAQLAAINAAIASMPGSTTPAAPAKEPAMPNVTPESIRSEALSLMRQHPGMDLTTATARAETVLRIEHNEPAIQTWEQWQRATLAEQNAHLALGFEEPESPMDLFTRDPDAFVEQYPDSPDAIALREAQEYSVRSPEEQADWEAAKALLADVDRRHADMARGGYGLPKDVLLTNAQAPEGVRKAARAQYDAREAAAAAKAAEPSVADLRAAVDAGLAAASRGE